MGKAARRAQRRTNSERPTAAPIPQGRDLGSDRSARRVVVEAGYPEGWRVELHNQAVRLTRLHARQNELVEQALRAGATWSAIASVLGISRQAAHRRFRSLAPAVRESVGS
jgi:hypothetical protein